MARVISRRAPPVGTALSSATGARDVRAPVATLRLSLLVVCTGLALLSSAPPATVPVLLGLAVLALAAYRLPLLAPRWPALAVAEGLLVALAVPFTDGERSPLLPYLLVPALVLGLTAGPAAVAGSSLVTATALTLAAALHGGQQATVDFVTACAQWLVLGLAVGLVAVWARRLAPPVDEGAGQLAEARDLLRQLRAVTRHLPGGLDAQSAAEAVLDRCHGVAGVSRSAVLIRPSADALTPIAVRGTKRVPWRAPLSAPGPLHEAWHGRRVVLDVRTPDAGRKRRGSALAVVPLLGDDTPFGLVILESFALDAFDGRLDRLRGVVDEGALRLETALLFDEVRATATLEERDRLAREMHDGVAQEIAFVGYRLDDLRSQAAKVDSGLADAVTQLRKDLTRLISDIRLSITDLRTSVGANRGLGQALSTYVRAVGSGKHVTVHLLLQESTFRLPGEQEVLLLQVAQTVAQDVRRITTARNLWVTLQVDPPAARLVVEHDGDLQGLDVSGLEAFAGPLAKMGGTIDVRRAEHGGPSVTVVLEGGDDDDDDHARR